MGLWVTAAPLQLLKSSYVYTDDSDVPSTSLQRQQYADVAAYDEDEASTAAEEGEEGEEGSEKQQLPEPPPRSWYLPDLFAKAAEITTAQELDEGV